MIPRDYLTVAEAAEWAAMVRAVEWVGDALYVPYEAPPPPPPRDHRTRSAVRNERVRRATPAWADRPAIRRIYAEARSVTARTGIAHHVDHVVPIDGITVCGLHVAGNLRVIPASVNVRRSRVWTVE
jgi:hypothetical protein